MKFFKRSVVVLGCLPILLTTCVSNKKQTETLTIFHAGSLAVPLKAMADSFKILHPQASFNFEAAGSVECARKISELGRNCDIMASADYKVIDELLIPNHADWNLLFAGNEMIIAFTEKSKQAQTIDSTNWHRIILEPNIYFGRSDPNADPCGYRTLQVLQLAQRHYQLHGFYNTVEAKDNRFIRPKEVDLIAMLQSGAIDYLFIYRSVAIQHQLRFVELPKTINLGDPNFAEHYAQASVTIRGAKPNSSIQMVGEPMVYSFTIPNNSLNKELAQEFTQFMVSPKGLQIFDNLGMPTIAPRLSPVSKTQDIANILGHGK